MKLEDAILIIRKELIIKDEPLKAYNMLLRFKEEHGIELPELEKTKKMIIHYFDPKELDFTHNENMDKDDFEIIEPPHYAEHAEERYWRYAWVLDNLKKDKAKSYLDMGCYVGSMVTTAASRGIRGVGVDLTKKAVEHARRRAKNLGLKNTTFYQGDVTKFDKEIVDCVSSMEVLEHVIDPAAYLKHLADLANKWVYVSTPNGPYGNGEGNLPNWDWRGPTDRRGHLVVFTPTTLRKMIEDQGMEIKELLEGEDQLLHVKYRRAK